METEGAALACKSFKTMNIRELRQEVAEHGWGYRTGAKRKLDFVEFLSSRGRAKFAYQESEPLVCGLSDELWTMVAFELQKKDLQSLVRLGKTCRQLRRVVHKSGLWASLLSVLVKGASVAPDQISAVLKNGHVLAFDECEEAVQAIALMLPQLCFRALIRNRGVLPLHRDCTTIEDLHGKGYLRLDVDNLQYIFRLRRYDIRVTQAQSFSARKVIRDWFFRFNAIPAPLVLEIAFRRVKSAQCVQNLRRGVLHRRTLFNKRCVEFEQSARRRKLVLPLKYLHFSQRDYASEKYGLEESLKALKKAQVDILAKNREEELQEALAKHGIKLSAFSTCCQDYIQQGDSLLSLESIVDRVRETAFYYRCTSYAAFRSRVLMAVEAGKPSTCQLSCDDVIDICFSEIAGAEDLIDFSLPSSDIIADDALDWTRIGYLVKRVALFAYLKDTQTGDIAQTLPPSLLKDSEQLRERMHAIATGLTTRMFQLDGNQKALAWVCKATLNSSQPLHNLLKDDTNFNALLRSQATLVMFTNAFDEKKASS